MSPKKPPVSGVLEAPRQILPQEFLIRKFSVPRQESLSRGARLPHIQLPPTQNKETQSQTNVADFKNKAEGIEVVTRQLASIKNNVKLKIIDWRLS